MTGRQLVLWGVAPEDYYPRQGRRVPLKVTAGDLQHVSGEAVDRLRQGWRELVAVPVGTHPRDVATCGACGRSWDAERHPTPASLCPFCNGDDRAAAAHECYRHPAPRPADDDADLTDLDGLALAVGNAVTVLALTATTDGVPEHLQTAAHEAGRRLADTYREQQP